MNTKWVLKIFLLVFVAIGAATSCTNPTNEETEETQDSSANTETESNVLKTTYKVPSPVELYEFMRQSEVAFNGQVLNTPSNQSKYNTSVKKAINLGVFASDLAYCTMYEKVQEGISYFKATKLIADEMGLAEGFDEIITKRVEQNENNTDSLYEISADAYWKACNYLEAEGKTDVLAFVLAGAWVESVYIAIGSVNKFSQENEVVIRIAEQHFALENLIDYLRKNAKKNDDIKKLISGLESIYASYEKLYDNDEETIITKEQFEEVTIKISKLRNEFIN